MDPNTPHDQEPQNTESQAAENNDHHTTSNETGNPYQPPGSGTSPRDSGELTHDERQFAMFCHFAAFAGLIIPFGSIIGPLVMWLIKKDESQYIDYHGKEALNFNITMAIVSIFCFALIFVVIGVFLLPIVLILWLIFIIVAGVKANDGLYYRYPFCIRFIS